METLWSVCAGVGLAAACGLRVFLPLLVLGVASRWGQLEVVAGLDWVGSTPALIMFGLATALELAAYSVPWLDNLLDSLAAPAAVAAGVLAAGAVLTDIDPWLRWTIALVAGGGTAGGVHVLTAGLRQASSLLTAGLGNPLLATAEAGGAVALAAVAVALPLAAAVLVVLFVLAALRWGRRRAAARSAPS